MLQKLSRLGALLLLLAIVLNACAAVPGGAGSAAPPPPDIDVQAPDQSEEAVPVIVPEPEPEPQPVLTQQDVEGALSQVMERYSAVGVAVATVERGLLSQAGAWGWAVKDKREMTPDTKIRIASISKVVVGLCAMAMKEDGLIDLDAPISDYWGA